MRILILLLAVLLSLNTAFAKPSKRSVPPLPEYATPFPIDAEFQTDFEGYDAKDAKDFAKEQKVKAKLNTKRKKLEMKKAKLEQNKEVRIKNCERSQVFIEQLKNSDENL